MRDPRLFVVIQNNRFLFTVYAHSIEQARMLVAARLAGHDRRSHRRAPARVRRDDPHHQERPRRADLHLGATEMHPSRA
jgi:hypothetical protein